MNKRFIIYVLHHMNSSRVYIGKSTSGMRRPTEHSMPSSLNRYAHLPRSKWIKSLQKRGLEPKIVVLEECIANELNEAEIFYIAYFRSIGMQLLNLTDGGDGFKGEHTEEACAKMSAIRKKKVAENPKEYERIVSLSQNYWSNDSAREKKREERTGKKWDEETKAKIAAALKGKKKSVEHKANLSIAASAMMKIRWQDSKYRAQHIKAAILRTKNPEFRKKISDATKAGLARKSDLP